MAKKNDIVREVVVLAGKFVTKHKGEWDHEAWEGFLKKAGKLGADTSESGQVLLGKLLETTKKLYVSLQEPKPKEAAPAKPTRKKASKPTDEG